MKKHRSKLSPVVRHLGYTASPLPLAKWLKLREAIQSIRVGDTSKRVHLPPVILSCDWCQKKFQREAFSVNKQMRRGHKDNYCCLACSQAHHAIKNARKCAVCGKPMPVRHTKYHKACRPKPSGRIADHPAKTQICAMCNVPFRAKWRGKRANDYMGYCSRLCANRAHSRRMAGKGNPKYKHGATPLRIQPYCAKAYRLMRPLILKRDGHACVVCGATHKLHVHHIDNWPMNNAASNLVTLCPKCHSTWHAAKDSKPSRTLWPWLSEYVAQPLFTISK